MILSQQTEAAVSSHEDSMARIVIIGGKVRESGRKVTRVKETQTEKKKPVIYLSTAKVAFSSLVQAQKIYFSPGE